MKKGFNQVLLVFVLMILWSQVLLAIVPERRRPQQSAKPNRYYALPWFINIEGIGALWGGVLGVANIADSGTNLGLVNFQNDNFHVFAGAIDDIYLLGDYKGFASLTLSGGKTSVKLKELKAWDVGPDSDPEPIKVNGTMEADAIQLQQKLFYDRLRISLESYASRDSIRQANVQENGKESTSAGNRLKLELDLTDDRYDARVGLKLSWIVSRHQPDGNFLAKNETEEDYDLVKREASLFIPVYSSLDHNHTIAMNYFLSTLHNRNKDVPVSRRNGHSLGGPMQLRGYPLNRFTDNNAVHLILEHRWTIIDTFGTEEPGIISNDVLEGLQLAFFHDWGRVSEFNDERLHEEEMKTSYGVGCRLVFMSGLIIRLDIGFSEEGQGETFLVQQPF